MKSRLSPKQRRSRILDFLFERGSVVVSELSEELEVSEMSIRNDLNYLHEQGKLIRRHGGAAVTAQQNDERPLSEKHLLNFRQKAAICRRAASLVSNNMPIVLDAGTTNEQLVRHLTNFSNLTVITNGINLIWSLLEHPSIQVYTVGGRVDSKSCSIVGENAENGFRTYKAQIGFLTADGISLDHGITNNSQEATNNSRVLIDISMKRVLLADSSKVQKLGAFHLCTWEQIDTWITDSDVDHDFVQQIERMGVNVLIAKLPRKQPRD